jgi:UDP-glucuronate 4-epimerase
MSLIDSRDLPVVNAERAVVTGCAGFIGSQITEALLGMGVSVLGIDCFNDNYGRAQKLRNLEHASSWSGFEFVPVDLSRGSLEDLVEGCDVVFHLAAEPGVRPSWSSRFEGYLRNNVHATQQLLEAVKADPSTRVVYASSSSVYGQAERFPTSETDVPRPHSPYGVTKLAAEHLCHLYGANYGLDVVALRFFSVYGPRQRPDMAFNRFCAAAIARDEAASEITVFGDGEQRRDFTYVDDVVRATLSAASSQAAVGHTYNVGGGSQVSVNDVLRLLTDLTGCALNVRYLPAQRGDVRDTGAATDAARRDLDFGASVPLMAGIEAELEWVCAQQAIEVS